MPKQRAPPAIISKVGFDFHWSSKKVWGLDVPVTEMRLKELEWHFKIPFWDTRRGWYDLTPNQVMAKPKAHKAEFGRILKSDLKHPIDIMRNKGRWLILDGLHRLAKARILGLETVQVRRIPRSAVPKILK